MTHRILSVLLGAALTVTAIQAATGAATPPGVPPGGELVTLREAPAALDPPVTYLGTAPVIDGRLDPTLATLPLRAFSVVLQTRAGLPLPEASYRLAYGAGFLYVYVEAKAERLVFRDRAYQNGDGFHLVLATPRPGDEPSREFAVIACSAVDRPQLEWSRRFIWYANVDRLFLRLSRDARLEFAAAGGAVSFELLLPWKDVHPLHPWLSDGVGFNLALARAAADNAVGYPMVVFDPDIQTEQRPRRYARLRFEPPAPAAGVHSFVRLDRGHLAAGAALTATVVAAGPAGADEELALVVTTGEGATVRSTRTSVACTGGVASSAVELDTADLPPGGYRVEWESRRGPSRGEASFSVLPHVDVAALAGRAARLPATVSEGTRTTLEFLIAELAGQLAAVRPFESCGGERIRLARVLDDLESAQRGDDPLRRRTGLVRRAFRSRLDGTLQPYVVRVPNDYDPARPAPLVVFLHGSGSDETAIPRPGVLSRGGALELCPRARGTSHAYVLPEAQEDIAEAIADAGRQYAVDPRRIVLTGFSMGGYGVYRTYWQTPSRFRALAVFAGHPDLGNRWTGAGTHPSFLDPATLASFAGVPVFVFHGARDRNTPFELTERLVETLRRAGARVEFATEAETGHELPGPATQAAYHRWLGEVLHDDEPARN